MVLDKIMQINVSEVDLLVWKQYAKDLYYENFSLFVRECLNATVAGRKKPIISVGFEKNSAVEEEDSE